MSLIIENALSLSADQHSKIKSANTAHGLVKAFNIHSIRTKMNKYKVYNLLITLPSNTDATMFIFSSPEYLLKEL